MYKISIATLLLLTACSTTPQERYYVLTTAVTESGNVVETYVDTCKTLPAENICHAKLPAINKAAKTLQSQVAGLDKIFVSGTSEYYNLTLTVTENALNDLKKAMQ